MLLLFYGMSVVAEVFLCPAVEVSASLAAWLFRERTSRHAQGHGRVSEHDWARLHCTCCHGRPSPPRSPPALAQPVYTVKLTALSPSLQHIAVLLRLSPDIAGITLLAFASGAPDIFTELAAINGGTVACPSPLSPGLSECSRSLTQQYYREGAATLSLYNAGCYCLPAAASGA